MEAEGFKHCNLIQYSTVNQYHIVIQISFMSTLWLSIQQTVDIEGKIAELQCLLIGVRDDMEGAETMIHCSYFEQWLPEGFPSAQYI